MQFQENKAMLGVIAILLVLFAGAVFIYNNALNNLANGSCSEAGACPHEEIVKTQNIVISVLILVIGIVVLWLFWQMRKKPEAHMASQNYKQRKSIDASALDSDEKKVLEVLQESDGSLFQSEVIRRLGYSKVKVSRILDRMEQRGIIERKRRGMANLIVLK